MELEDDAQHKELLEMWDSIRPRLVCESWNRLFSLFTRVQTKSLELRDLGNSTQVPKLRKAQLQALNKVLNQQIPHLRKTYEEGREK